MNPNYTSTASIPQTATAHIWLFVYGTLQSGQRNHERYCRGALSITPATTWGRLYALPAGYSALVIPERHVLACGTVDSLADAAVQIHLAAKVNGIGPVTPPTGDWDVVHGELIVLADPLRNLPPIDRLEGFHPGYRSLYEHVLAPVVMQDIVWPCWTYIMPRRPRSLRLRDGLWPSAKL